MAPSSSLGTHSSLLSTRSEFTSEIDIRKAKTASNTTCIPSSTTIGRNNIQHSNSSSAIRTSDYHHHHHQHQHQVTYMPQTSASATVSTRSQSVYPPSLHMPDSLPSSSVPNRLTSTNINNIYTSTTSLNSTASGGTTTATITTGRASSTNNIPLTRKSIIEYSNRTFRVIFSDDSVMIIRDDSPDGQIFIDAQGKSYSFDRRQPDQPEAIQERLALFYQNEHDVVDYTVSP